MTLDKALTWFSHTWIGLACILTLMSFTGTIIGAPTVWTGILRVMAELNPFNVKYYITIVLLFSPAIFTLMWRDKRRRKLARPNQVSSATE